MAKRISVEQLIILHNQLEAYPPRNLARKALVEEFAHSFGVTPSTVYRQLRQCIDFSLQKRKDFNKPRAISSDDMLMYCRLIAALKIRTSNKNNRHLSTPKCIEILELHGIETAHGLIKSPIGVLKKTTVNRYITQWGFSHHSMLSVEPVVVHFETDCLSIELKTHMPRGSDGRRTTARGKGKIERTNRTTKESFETLFHFHQPSTLDQANEWLMNYLRQYMEMSHRSEKSTRIQAWLNYLPTNGYRQMCSWEKFCQFVREPETRLVGFDACVSIDGISYQLIPDMAGNEVVLLLGLLDNEVYVEFNEQKMGPFYPSSGPIPLNSYRKQTKTKTEKVADDIASLAQSISVPLSVMTGNDNQTIEQLEKAHVITKNQPFIPFEEEKIRFFVDKLEAKQFIAHFLGKPLAELPLQQINAINQIVEETLNKDLVESKVRQYFTLSLHQIQNKD